MRAREGFEVAASRKYRLYCGAGLEVVLQDTGAALYSVRMADRRGAWADVTLPAQDAQDPSCAGMTLAPYAGRIAGGRLRVDGQTVQLTVNEGQNQLHGGAGALMHQPWCCIGRQSGRGFEEISFCAQAEDGQDGFPGNRRFVTTYRLHASQRLEIELTATTDRPTRVNLSNHAYWNLSGDLHTGIEGHLLSLRADRVYLNDGAFLPQALVEAPAALDYRQSRPVGGAQGDEQRVHARGLNHCYVLRKGDATAPAATLTDPVSGRRMRLYTDQPCVVVYSGGFLPSPGCAIALEAQEHPESPLAPPPDTLYPGQVYRRLIVYRFDVAGDKRNCAK